MLSIHANMLRHIPKFSPLSKTFSVHFFGPATTQKTTLQCKSQSAYKHPPLIEEALGFLPSSLSRNAS